MPPSEENIERGARLRQARKFAGYGKASDFWRVNGFTEATYNAHENGNRGFTSTTAKRYARLLSCSAAWLLTGEGQPDDQAEIPIIGCTTSLGGDVLMRKMQADREEGDGMPTHAPAPFSTKKKLSAIYVKEPIVITLRSGGYIHTEEPTTKNFQLLLNKPCLVETHEGQVFICELTKGYTTGKYNLVRGSSIIADSTVIWARRIHAINPA